MQMDVQEGLSDVLNSINLGRDMGHSQVSVKSTVALWIP
jgi:hypothetical protein